MPERVIKVIRSESPAIVEMNGIYLEEDFDIDTNHFRFYEVSLGYIEARYPNLLEKEN